MSKSITATSASPEEQAIRRAVDVWIAASEQGDLTTLLNLLADDVIMMVPGKEPFDKETFAQNYQQMRSTQLKVESEIQEIKVLGDWAWMHNFLKVKFTPADGKTVIHSGHVLTIFRKSDSGQWVIARDANMLTPETVR